MEEAIPLEYTKSGMFKKDDNLVLVNSSENFRISAKVFSISPYRETYIQLELLEPGEFIYQDEFWNSPFGLDLKDKSGTVAIEAIIKKLIKAFHLTYDSDGNFMRISDSGFNIDKIIFVRRRRKRKGRQSTEAATTRATRAATAAREEEYEEDENYSKRTRGSASGLKKKSSKKYIKNKKSSRKNKKQKTRKSKKNRKNKK